MKANKYNWILYLISATILITIAVQFYWNYKNYEQNKQRVLNEIQLSLDNAVEQYYADLSKNNFLTIVKPKDTLNGKVTTMFDLSESNKSVSIDSLLTITRNNKVSSIKIKNKSDNVNKPVTVWNKSNSNTTTKNGKKNTTTTVTSAVFTQLNKSKKSGIHFENKKASNVKVFKGKRASDSLKLVKNIQTIFISIHNDSLRPKQLDSILKKELTNKKIDINYNFQFLKKDSLQSEFTSQKNFIIDNEIEAKSTFLGIDKKLKMFFENPTKEALKRSFTGILVSLLLALAVISSLFYLLYIINKQKQLSEIKNDLISNITHEFKTPITTVSTALEAIDDFNVISDTEKTKNYVTISRNQIQKLHLMVEKLLETATLDSENLLLKKENTDVVHLLKNLTEKHQLTSNKNIVFKSLVSNLYKKIDVFHFENAISNLIDNAIKYGGNNIEINISSEEKKLKIEVADNGKGIEKQQQNKIFDKFYRVPKGNTHNVKGFGIGLYYTKKIIEKHGGSIDVFSNSVKTIFTILV